MPIALTDDHRELGDVARSFLTAQKARGAARDRLDADAESRPPFWGELADLGWLGLHIDERYGGSGFGLPELVVVIDELGRAVAPGPFVPTVVASAVIDAVGSDTTMTEALGCTMPSMRPGSVIVDDFGHCAEVGGNDRGATGEGFDDVAGVHPIEDLGEGDRPGHRTKPEIGRHGQDRVPGDALQDGSGERRRDQLAVGGDHHDVHAAELFGVHPGAGVGEQHLRAAVLGALVLCDQR